VLDDSLEIRLHLEVRHGEVRVLTAVFDDNTLHHGRDIIELVTDPRILQHVQFVGEESSSQAAMRGLMTASGFVLMVVSHASTIAQRPPTERCWLAIARARSPDAGQLLVEAIRT